MTLYQRVQQSKIRAMKDHLPVVSRVCGYLIAQAQGIAKADGNREVTDADVVTATKRIIKQNNDAIAQSGADSEYAKELAADNLILKNFLPEQLTEDQIRTTIEMFLKETPNMNKGALMKSFKEYLTGSSLDADMKLVTKVVDEVLSV